MIQDFLQYDFLRNSLYAAVLIGLVAPLLGVFIVIRRLSLIADWNTGKNRFGYAAAGFGLAVSKKSYLSSAYYFGNQGRGNNSFGIYYGLTF